MDKCDVVVPLNQVAVFVKFVKSLERSHQIRIRYFGHAGDGNLHVYLCKDQLTDALWRQKRGLVMQMMYDKAIVELEGQVSGEHGISHAKRSYLQESVGDKYMELLTGIKLTFDPKHILNPGKVCFPN